MNFLLAAQIYKAFHYCRPNAGDTFVIKDGDRAVIGTIKKTKESKYRVYWSDGYPPTDFGIWWRVFNSSEEFSSDKLDRPTEVPSNALLRKRASYYTDGHALHEGDHQ